MKIEDVIIKVFEKYENPSDDLIHKIAEKIGMDKHKFEEEIYKTLHNFVKFRPGKHRHIDASKYDAEQMKVGINIEKEHTDCPLIAAEITKDHLAEIPDYYTRLIRMEKEAEVAGVVEDVDESTEMNMLKVAARI